FLDHDDLPAGLFLTPALERALKRSAQLVIVTTSGAVQSKYVALEIEAFSASGRTILPIDLGGALGQATWPALQSKELIWIDESPERLHPPAPTAVGVARMREH